LTPKKKKLQNNPLNFTYVSLLAHNANFDLIYAEYDTELITGHETYVSIIHAILIII